MMKNVRIIGPGKWNLLTISWIKCLIIRWKNVANLCFLCLN